MTFKQKKKNENSPSELELSDLCYHMKKFPALERPMFAFFFFFFCLVTDENSESDSDTEEKLKGEKSRCCAGCVLVTGKVRRWRFLLSVRAHSVLAGACWARRGCLNPARVGLSGS